MPHKYLQDLSEKKKKASDLKKITNEFEIAPLRVFGKPGCSREDTEGR